ncbi:hypothetical protein SAMN05421504_101870 [Amycolatopsis xylanica]|uniref:Uncharacterized protein n=1 Tax=Amycolatopsis xylanica TaxID=589385 RepID=A0A1H2UF19_9PSEU|nr:hypothetical protein [Amycolatopsis xylanica]SDW54783.1 hypothetical protein SAMN05421504_101870 [Amycolatopsis xylanica]
MDENTFVIPEQWWPHIHQRRGGRLREVKPIDTEAEKFFQAELERVLPSWPSSVDDPALLAEARAYADGEANPFGAALGACLVLRAYSYDEREKLDILADAWTTRHGLAFAARAAVELGRVDLKPKDVGSDKWVLGITKPDEAFYLWPGHVLTRARELLAAASDDEYAEAVAAIEDQRADLLTRSIAAYLAPDREDWVDELCALAVKRGGPKTDWTMLLCSIGTAEQFEALAAVGRVREYVDYLNVLYTVADGVGPAIAPTLARLLDRKPNNKTMLDMLARFPTDEAFDLLLARSGTKRAPAAIEAATARFPERAAARRS